LAYLYATAGLCGGDMYDQGLRFYESHGPSPRGA
jgi:hypothetical protein